MKRHQDKINEALIPDVPEWDDGMVWTEIEKTLPKKRKKRIFFWLFPAVLCLITINLVNHFLESEESIIPKQEAIRTISPATTVSEIVKKTKSTAGVNEEIVPATRLARAR